MSRELKGLKPEQELSSESSSQTAEEHRCPPSRSFYLERLSIEVFGGAALLPGPSCCCLAHSWSWTDAFMLSR